MSLMATMSESLVSQPAERSETAPQRAARLAEERELLEVGREDLRAGRSLSGPELEAWLNRWAVGDPVDTTASPHK